MRGARRGRTHCLSGRSRLHLRSESGYYNEQMLVIERAFRHLAALPRVMRAGVTILLAGLAMDVLAHAGWSSGLGAGHLVTFVGMVVATAGLFALALRRPRTDMLAEKRRQG